MKARHKTCTSCSKRSGHKLWSPKRRNDRVRPFMEQHQFPATRSGLTRKFKCGLDVYVTVNLKPDGDPGEVFVKLGKQGSTVSGLMQAWAVTISAALQRGVSPCIAIGCPWAMGENTTWPARINRAAATHAARNRCSRTDGSGCEYGVAR